MQKIKKYLFSLSKFELILWISSLIVIVGVFIFFQEKDYLSLVTSIIGATALIFLAKGNVIGAILSVLFGTLYVIISYELKYYGEMITYGLMTVPISIFAIISWIKNPSKENSVEVKINNLTKKEYLFSLVLGIVITIIFSFILKYFGTANLIVSTISVFTSFEACYLTQRRSEYYALFYAANDIVLIVLWTLATISSTQYILMVICFVIFLINDLYAFINWKKMKKRQK